MLLNRADRQHRYHAAHFQPREIFRGEIPPSMRRQFPHVHSPETVFRGMAWIMPTTRHNPFMSKDALSSGDFILRRCGHHTRMGG
jgi:hypothetical protein